MLRDRMRDALRVDHCQTRTQSTTMRERAERDRQWWRRAARRRIRITVVVLAAGAVVPPYGPGRTSILQAARVQPLDRGPEAYEVASKRATVAAPDGVMFKGFRELQNRSRLRVVRSIS
jgi:hypothetical protein